MSATAGAVGPDVDIMVDFHGRPASVTRRSSTSGLADAAHVRGGARPARGSTGSPRSPGRSRMPIAAGERLVGLREFLPSRGEGIQHRPARHLPHRRAVGTRASPRWPRPRCRRRPAQPARADRRRRRPAFRHLHPQRHDPGGNDRRRDLVRRRRALADPAPARTGDKPEKPGLGVEVDEAGIEPSLPTRIPHTRAL